MRIFYCSFCLKAIPLGNRVEVTDVECASLLNPSLLIMGLPLLFYFYFEKDSFLFTESDLL